DQPAADDYRQRFPGLTLGWLDVEPATTRCDGASAAMPSIPGYELLGSLGQGGMGVVYKARQIILNRVVALKMIRAGAGAGPDERARFHREAEAVASLQHPNIIQIYQVEQNDSQPFFAMEHVEGGSLTQKIAGIPQPGRAAAQLVATLARAMH